MGESACCIIIQPKAPLFLHMAADSLSVNVCSVSPGQMLIVCLCQTTSHCAAPFTKNDMWYRWKIWGICKLWCTDWIEFYCFPHCLFLFFTEWKTPVSFCEQVQQYIKGEQITHKWDNWMAFIHHRLRRGNKDRRGCVRWAVERSRD